MPNFSQRSVMTSHDIMLHLTEVYLVGGAREYYSDKTLLLRVQGDEVLYADTRLYGRNATDHQRKLSTMYPGYVIPDERERGPGYVPPSEESRFFDEDTMKRCLRFDIDPSQLKDCCFPRPKMLIQNYLWPISFTLHHREYVVAIVDGARTIKKLSQWTKDEDEAKGWLQDAKDIFDAD